MSVLEFILCLVVFAVLLMGFYSFPIRNWPKGINLKKIKVKYLTFLFYTDKRYDFGYLPTTEKESKCQKEKPYKEIPIKLFVFLIIGYIINFLACIVVIICFCLNIDIMKYVAIAGLAEFVILGCFAVII